ncbi:LytTR family DNA-binding domain-containing protein [Clostridium thermarum]|uniref:LytTR family DNA-binding domain-containing protein n=1 Tax=Clostridium thermarum TaxID=1716543 RepID=UPI0013D6E7F7|nr:LytTR family DNA-binding domain-containing protein [Clostridium thermarum]
MKIIIDQSPNYEETEVIIKCSKVDEGVKRLISILKAPEEKIMGILNGVTHLIDPQDIFYFESVDKKTFIYTEAQVLETHLRLYELEEKLGKQDFFRASKSTIINISRIKKLSPRFNGRLDVLLENDEKLVVSRQYVPVLKEILGL